MKLVKPLLMIGLTICSLALKAGWEIVYRIDDPEGWINYNVLLIEDNALKYTAGSGSCIYNSDNGEFTFIVNDSKSYWKGKIAEFRPALDTAMITIIDEILTELPENQHIIYEQFLNDLIIMYSSPTPEALDTIAIEIKNTGLIEEIAGFEANKFEIMLDGRSVESVWISMDLDVSSDLDPDKIVMVMNQVEPNIENKMLYKFSDAYLELFNSGYTLKSEIIGGEIATVIKAAQREIKAEEFSIPENFTLVTATQLIKHQIMGSNQGSDKDW